MLGEHLAVLPPAEAARALADATPRIHAEMHRINRLLADGQREAAIAQFHALASLAVGTQRSDLVCQGHMVAAGTTRISVVRIPAAQRVGKPIALFLPGLLATLAFSAVRALAFVDLFDIVLCELPGHGASGQPDRVSLDAFAAEYAALIDTALPRATALTLIGESLGGLVALTLGRLRPDRVKTVILVDTPFHLTRPELAACIGEAWRAAGSRPYIRRICIDIMGFDPVDGQIERVRTVYDLARAMPFACAHIVGGHQPCSSVASTVSDADLAALREASSAMRITPRIAGTGHAVLLDNPAGARAALEVLIAPP